MLELHAQGAPVVLQPAHLAHKEVTLPAQLAPLLLLRCRNADRLQLMRVAVEVTREPHAKFTRIQTVVLALAFRGQAHGCGDDGVRPHGDQRVMERIAKAAGFVDGVHHVSGSRLLLHPGDKSRA